MEKGPLLRAAVRANTPRRYLRTAAAVAASRCSNPPSPASPRPWLFVGLGNPGEKYQATRHNVILRITGTPRLVSTLSFPRPYLTSSPPHLRWQVGFEMIDAFAQSVGISMGSVHCKALFGHGLVGGTPVLLAKPQTYMNLSGESAGPLAAYYKLPLDRVVLIFDDMGLPCGVLRLQQGGGHGGHNGLKSIIQHFRGNKEFGRLRIGIGRPPGQMDPKAFVLQNFNATARDQIETALHEGVGILKDLVAKGLTECARPANMEQKYKHLRPQTMSS